MKRSFAFLLLVLVCAACKKDSKPPLTFKGVVLRRADLSPVANAIVGMNITTLQANAGTTTDAKGNFTVAFDNTIDPSLITEYFTVAQKKGMVQLRSTFKRTRDQFPDTILLDDASYLKIEITVKTPPVPQESLKLHWDFLKTADMPAVSGAFYKAEDLYRRLPVNSFSLIDSFSHFERPRLFAELLLINSKLESKQVSFNDILLQKQDTNYIKIEY